ncbi:uncharacterized protein LOC141615217 [Silene latifolia]|uniref:uncharacterized protein LOC141615217 n=1 Tax=Silene latifolia TaxID=37657 RepID=UPI003D77CE41
MSQLMNQAASASDPPVKRRRGRPRKDETPAIEKPSLASRPILRSVSCTLGNSSGAFKGNDTIQVDADLSLSTDDDYNNDEMVGQVVTGVLECAFDAGYFLRVRVGDSDMYMRGVVFKEGCVVPVTPENDIAPNAKMYTRRDIPIPTSFTPQSHSPVGRVLPHSPTIYDAEQKETKTETVDHQLTVAFEKPTGIVEGKREEREKEDVPETSENVLNQPEEKQAEKEPSIEPAENGNEIGMGEVNVNVSLSDKLEVEKDRNDPPIEVKEKEDSSRRSDLDDLSEIPLKMRKTNEVTVACSNVQPLKEEDGCEVSLKEICDSSGFQISMENGDGDSLLTEQPSEVTAMETE